METKITLTERLGLSILRTESWFQKAGSWWKGLHLAATQAFFVSLRVHCTPVPVPSKFPVVGSVRLAGHKMDAEGTPGTSHRIPAADRTCAQPPGHLRKAHPGGPASNHLAHDHLGVAQH